jgi:chromosome segregation ATPase
MPELDQAVVNLERFVALLANATSAVGQVEDHVVDNGRQFGELEEDAGEEGGGLNDRLEELATTLDSAEAEAVDAAGDLARVGSEAQQDVSDVRTRVEQAATDLEKAAADASSHLGQASTRLDGEGFSPFHEALDTAQQELDGTSQETEHAMTDLVTAVDGFEKEAEAAWDEAGAELEEAKDALLADEAALEAAAQDGVHGFDAAADALEDACGSLVNDVDQIYDALDAGVAAAGQEWDQAVDGAVQEAVAFVADARRHRLEETASLVHDTALSGLDHEYEAVGTVLDGAAAPLGELEPLAADLVKAQAVAVQVDELMNAL